MNELWPWLALAGLGAFHGINPAMGWLFAVALGMHRGSRSVIFKALPALAIGHALSIATVAGAMTFTGIMINQRVFLAAAGMVLIAWAIYHYFFGHRHRIRIGMQTGLAGLAFWSFVMATAHGAGAMVIPALMPLCLASPGFSPITAQAIASTALVAVAIHTGVMLVVAGIVALVVYDWIGVGILRRAWINFDAIWTIALAAMGGVLIAPWHSVF
ncbi:MAG TPA: hypothetical protein VH933_15815 [Aestuariivirgaceae bacterium]|jgi:hypothetical protein